MRPKQTAIARSGNLLQTAHEVAREDRAIRNRHRGGVLWFTGLPGAGKSTLAIAVEKELFQKGYAVYALDGDNLRRGLNADLVSRPRTAPKTFAELGSSRRCSPMPDWCVLPHSFHRIKATANALVQRLASTSMRFTSKPTWQSVRNGTRKVFTAALVRAKSPISQVFRHPMSRRWRLN
jgi:predicted ATPase